MINLDKLQEYFECSCCGYKTLEEEGDGYSYQICILCRWEDDWTFGGANGDYTLEEAQDNFKKYYVMYRVTDPDKYFKVYGEIIELKKKIMQILDQIEETKSKENIILLRNQVKDLEKELMRHHETLPVNPKYYFNK
jgi:hypothetical protein